MKRQIKQVTDFQIKNGFEVGIDFTKPMASDVGLEVVCKAIAFAAKVLENEFKISSDNRMLRAHLMCEELSETIAALIRKDELALLDGLTDLLYVVIGTGTNLPLEEAFEEVHRSNMTKTKKANDVRLRGKGDKYQKPDLRKVLVNYIRKSKRVGKD